jgi:hypothetical protein
MRWILGLVAVLATPGTTRADDCAPGPACSAADQEAAGRIAGWSALIAGKPSAHISTTVAYCTSEAVVATARRCAAEFAAAGRTGCAATMTAQAAVRWQETEAALHTARIPSAAPTTADCSALAVPVPHAGKWLVSVGPTTTFWVAMEKEGNFMGRTTGTATINKKTSPYTQIVSGHATSDGATATSTRGFTDPNIVNYPLHCTGQRSGNGYSGSCTSAWLRKPLPFSLRPQ